MVLTNQSEGLKDLDQLKNSPGRIKPIEEEDCDVQESDN